MPLPARNGESLKAHAERLATIRSKERECDKLEARLNREIQFNRKVELNRINRKAAYIVHFETSDLVTKCVKCLDKELHVSPL
jgi:hypothetical protein